jgi:hypothetical protein
MFENWKNAPKAGLVALALAYGLLFFYCTVTTTYADHIGLNHRIKALRKTVDSSAEEKKNAVAAVKQDLDGRLSALKESCARVEGANAVLTRQTVDQQGTINNCQTEAIKLLAPEPLQLRPFLWSDEVLSQVNHKTTFVIIANKTITPVRLLVECDVLLNQGTASIVGAGAYIGGSEIQQRKNLFVQINTPAWSNDTPLRVDIEYVSARAARCSFVSR